MPVRRWLRVALTLRTREWRERAQFDWRLTRSLLAFLLAAWSIVLRRLHRDTAELLTLGSLWRMLDTRFATEFSEGRLAEIKCHRGSAQLANTFVGMLADRAGGELVARLRASIGGSHPFDRRLLILKAPARDERGVIVVKYTDYFRHFATIFDTRLLSRDYHIVLEPSWSGFFLPDILAYQTLAPERVFVQTWEDRDRALLTRLTANLVPVALAPNAWANPMVFTAPEAFEKRYDAIVVSIWADFKRHYSIFRALRAANDRALRVACVGQPWPRSLASIEEEAVYFGVRSQVEFFESVAQPELARLYAASRIALLLSRKEGPNKAIVEAMLTGTPGFIRRGFNYGTRYAYLNAETGGFYDEAELPELLRNAHAGHFDSLRPAPWVRDHWSAIPATAALEASIFGDHAGRLEVKVNAPELDYLDPAARDRLHSRYAGLRRYLRG